MGTRETKGEGSNSGRNGEERELGAQVGGCFLLVHASILHKFLLHAILPCFYFCITGEFPSWTLSGYWSSCCQSRAWRRLRPHEPCQPCWCGLTMSTCGGFFRQAWCSLACHGLRQIQPRVRHKTAYVSSYQLLMFPRLQRIEY